MKDQELGLGSEWSPMYLTGCSSRFPRADILLKYKETFLKVWRCLFFHQSPQKNTPWGCSFPSPLLKINTAKESSGQNCCLEKKWRFFLEGVPERVLFGVSPRGTWSGFPVWWGFFTTIRRQEEFQGRPAGLQGLAAFHGEKVKRLFCRDLRFAERAASLQETLGQKWHQTQHTSPSHTGDPVFPWTLMFWLERLESQGHFLMGDFRRIAWQTCGHWD